MADYSKTLIDKAVANAGSRYRLAKQLGVSEQNLHAVYHQRRPLPMTWVYALAKLANVDPGEALEHVTDDKLSAQGKPRPLSALGVGGAEAVFDTSGLTAEAKKRRAKGPHEADEKGRNLTFLHIVSSSLATIRRTLTGHVNPVLPAIHAA